LALTGAQRARPWSLVDGKVVEATLLDNATARDLLSLLPMTLTLGD
jgi:hypothetical protein